MGDIVNSNVLTICQHLKNVDWNNVANKNIHSICYTPDRSLLSSYCYYGRDGIIMTDSAAVFFLFGCCLFSFILCSSSGWVRFGICQIYAYEPWSGREGGREREKRLTKERDSDWRNAHIDMCISMVTSCYINLSIAVTHTSNVKLMQTKKFDANRQEKYGTK